MTENFRPYKQKILMIAMCVLSAAGGLYYSVRVGHAVRLAAGQDVSLPLSGVILFFLLVQLYSNKTKRTSFSSIYRILVYLSGICVAFLVFGYVCLIACDLLFLVLRIFGLKRLRFEVSAGISAFASLVLVLYGNLHARKIKTCTYSIASPKIRKSYRVVQLSDLHLGAVVGAGQMRRAVQAVNALKPDLVVITGDMINHGQTGEIRHMTDTEDILAQIRAQAPVYAVTGNHDPAADDPVFRLFLKNSNIRLLDNEAVKFQDLLLYGRSGNSLQQRGPLAFNAPEDAYTILLDHYPDGAEEAAKAGTDLFLAGHTHAGQYFPCTFMVRKAYPGARRHGMSAVGKMSCIVCGGTSFFQIPVRVGTDSEVVCVDLVPAP